MTERTREDRLRGLVKQIRRDQAVLTGPPEYVGGDRVFYEERVRLARLEAAGLEDR